MAISERRKETRHLVPELYQKYFTLKIKKDPEGFMPVELLDFSPSGIRIRAPMVLEVDSAIECLAAIPKSLSREIQFYVMVKYLLDDEQGGYVVGAEVIQTADTLGLELFSKVHNFIKERIGEIF